MDPTGVGMLTENFNVNCLASNSKDRTQKTYFAKTKLKHLHWRDCKW